MKEVGDPVLIFDGDEFDLDATVKRNPDFAVIPFPENRILESFGAAGREVQPIVPGKWADVLISDEQVRIRGAYGNPNRKLCTVYIRRRDAKYVSLRLAMGEWSRAYAAVSVRIQPRLPRAAAGLTPTEILDPVAAKQFAKVPNPLHSAATLVAQDGRVMALWAPDGWNATAIFDARSGTFMNSLSDTPGLYKAKTARISLDSAYIATLSAERVTVWDTGSGAELSTLSRSYSSLAFGDKGELVLSRDRALEIRDVRDLSKVHTTLPYKGSYVSLNASADGSRLAAGSSNGEVDIWNLAAGAPLRKLKISSDRGNVEGLFSPDGRWLMALAGGPSSVIWDIETGARSATLPGYPIGFRTGAGPAEALMECGSAICGYRADGSLVGRGLILITNGGRPVGPDGRFLETFDGRIVKWSPDNGKVEYVLTLIGFFAPGAAWST